MLPAGVPFRTRGVTHGLRLRFKSIFPTQDKPAQAARSTDDKLVLKEHSAFAVASLPTSHLEELSKLVRNAHPEAKKRAGSVVRASSRWESLLGRRSDTLYDGLKIMFVNLLRNYRLYLASPGDQKGSADEVDGSDDEDAPAYIEFGDGQRFLAHEFLATGVDHDCATFVGSFLHTASFESFLEAHATIPDARIEAASSAACDENDIPLQFEACLRSTMLAQAAAIKQLSEVELCGWMYISVKLNSKRQGRGSSASSDSEPPRASCSRPLPPEAALR